MLADPPKVEKRVWKCENKQLDPGMKIISTILDSQTQKKGLRKEKYAPRPVKERNTGLEREKYARRPAQGRRMGLEM